MDWMVADPVKPVKKQQSWKKNSSHINQEASKGTDAHLGCCGLPDLNELFVVEVSPTSPVKTVRKRATKKTPTVCSMTESVTQSHTVTSVRKKRGLAKKKTASSADLPDNSKGNGEVLDVEIKNGDVAMSVAGDLTTDPASGKKARKRGPRKKALLDVPLQCLRDRTFPTRCLNRFLEVI
ncbi:hypothetical protein KC19_VG071300 [Ceratodon purpureus]|uniref:Uncharacterized protein n=1 Tax=Ceratodon purpureus TaxID=3225 RepID=A0A8T0HN88_CERPU|nr:hypothetical protein KC19_VG071300 [Ceratodon purpureus]